MKDYQPKQRHGTNVSLDSASGVAAHDGGGAWVLRRSRGGSVVPFDDPKAVADEMIRLWKLWKNGGLADSVARVDVEPYSRRHLTADLAERFDQIVRP